MSIFAIYKPKGLTSHDVIDRLRTITGEKRIGHAGTLDPLAEGVLVVAIGRESTKKLHDIVQQEKEYQAQITLGAESSTDDAEGELTTTKSVIRPTKQNIEKALKIFVGQINQIPPQFSAVKLNGQPAYKKARQGQELELKAREVEIKNIELMNYDWPLVEIRVVTGPGVYIRAIARDLGRKLKTGGYISKLVRTRVGQYKLATAQSLDQLAKAYQKD
jgi:tRNA pseudouridine55 synthase